MIFIRIPGMGDPSIATEGYNDGKWMIADSFSFGVEREMKESGEKGGTADINIGVGELQECVIHKGLDLTSSKLAQFSINGNSVGTAEIDFVEFAGGSAPPIAYLKFKLDRCFIKSWYLSGGHDNQPTEEVAFHYNKIAFVYAQRRDATRFEVSSPMSWDSVKNKPWPSHGIKMGVEVVVDKKDKPKKKKR